MASYSGIWRIRNPGVVQLVEWRSPKPLVGGSSPSSVGQLSLRLMVGLVTLNHPIEVRILEGEPI